MSWHALSIRWFFPDGYIFFFFKLLNGKICLKTSTHKNNSFSYYCLSHTHTHTPFLHLCTPCCLPWDDMLGEHTHPDVWLIMQSSGCIILNWQASWPGTILLHRMQRCTIFMPSSRWFLTSKHSTKWAVGRYSSCKPIPLLLAGTWTCFWVQNDLSWQSRPTQHLDDCLDLALNLLNLVSMRLYQMWGTSPVKQHPTSQYVCFPWRSGVSWALPTPSGAWKVASPKHNCGVAEKDRFLHNGGMSLRSIISCFPLAKAFSYLHSWEAQWLARLKDGVKEHQDWVWWRVACSR